MLLPSNTTHVLQPLDVSVYSPVKQAWKRILNTYKLKTRAANIGKEDFPGLLKQLWDSSFKESHLIGGFRETGLYPFNQSAIPSWKIAPALPIQARSSTDTTVAGETPLRSELRKCFIDAIKPREERQPQCRKKVIIHYGEALTNDETIERLREAEEEKKKKKTKRGGKKGKKLPFLKMKGIAKYVAMNSRKARKKAVWDVTTAGGGYIASVQVFRSHPRRKYHGIAQSAHNSLTNSWKLVNLF